MLKLLIRYPSFFSLLIVFTLLWVASVVRHAHSCNDLVEFESYKTCILHMGKNAAKKHHFSYALEMAKATALPAPDESKAYYYQCQWLTELKQYPQAIDKCWQAMSDKAIKANEEITAYRYLARSYGALENLKQIQKNATHNEHLRKIIFD